mmetsp:Transcript_14112/g.18499  ORF Transcript_14112/g.18499 Transcript_14112/m.18499 type:complete len:428 (+) Transcript_14112:165-1448(+)
MDFEFSRSSKKVKEEQKRRKEEARRKLAKEKALQEQARRKQQEIEDQIKLKRIEDAKKEEEEKQRQLEEAIKTGGISYCQSLLGLQISGEGDKVLLPASALEALSKQDAFGKGPMFFELTLGDRRTHCGVLEFTADEGTIGLPPKVMSSLGLALGPASQESSEGKNAADAGGTPLGEVQIKYVRLEKASFAQIRPEKAGLSQINEIRAVLEQNMRNHATLTVGDILTVWFRGKSYSCEVLEVRPQPQVTVIDTDMELELDLPAEVQEQLSPSIEGGRKLVETPHGPAGEGSSPAQANVKEVSPALFKTAKSEMDTDSDMDEEDLEELKEAHKEEKARGLPEEPDQNLPGAITCSLRQGGTTWSRRFRVSDKFRCLFDFAEAQGVLPLSYKIIRRFPRAVYTSDLPDCEKSFEEVGIDASEAFMLETS